MQVYVDSEFVGGCDIMIEAYQDGSLKEMLDVAVNSWSAKSFLGFENDRHSEGNAL